jgi:hypothetical protein
VKLAFRARRLAAPGSLLLDHARGRPFANVRENTRPVHPAAWRKRVGRLNGRPTGTARALKAIGNPKGDVMLWTLVVVLLVLWAVGLVTSTTMGGLIHLLLVAAVIVLLVRVLQGRRVA